MLCLIDVSPNKAANMGLTNDVLFACYVFIVKIQSENATLDF